MKVHLFYFHLRWSLLFLSTLSFFSNFYHSAQDLSFLNEQIIFPYLKDWNHVISEIFQLYLFSISFGEKIALFYCTKLKLPAVLFKTIAAGNATWVFCFWIFLFINSLLPKWSILTSPKNTPSNGLLFSSYHTIPFISLWHCSQVIKEALSPDFFNIYSFLKCVVIKYYGPTVPFSL